MTNAVGTMNSRVITLWVIADTRVDLPPRARCHLPLSRANQVRVGGKGTRIDRLLVGLVAVQFDKIDHISPSDG